MIDQYFDNLYEYSNIGHDTFAFPFGFYWAPVSYITDKHYYVKFIEDKDSPSGKRLYLKECDKDCFDSIDHPPIYEYKLESKEILYVSRCKRRLVLNLPCSIEPLMPPFQDNRLKSNIATVIPIFSLYDHDDEASPKYTPEIIKRIYGCLYPQFLPLPRKGPFPFVDSFCRVDSITTVKKEYIKPVHIRDKGFVGLSEECHKFIIQWINWFSGYKVEKEFDDIIRLFRDAAGYNNISSK